jgi:hypothetical protein
MFARFASGFGIAVVFAGAGACNDHRVQGDDEHQAGQSCLDVEDCVAGATCFEETCVGEGALRVSLAWDRRTDLDLHVLTPRGEEIYWENPKHSSGELDVDDCVIECRTWDGPHVENVFFQDKAEAGEYVVWIENYDGRRGANWRIEVVAGGEILAAWEGELPAKVGARSDATAFDYAP